MDVNSPLFLGTARLQLEQWEQWEVAATVDEPLSPIEADGEPHAPQTRAASCDTPITWAPRMRRRPLPRGQGVALPMNHTFTNNSTESSRTSSTGDSPKQSPLSRASPLTRSPGSPLDRGDRASVTLDRAEQSGATRLWGHRR